MEKLLLIAIPDTAGVEQIAAKLRLRTVTVAPEGTTPRDWNLDPGPARRLTLAVTVARSVALPVTAQKPSALAARADVSRIR